MTKTWFGPQDRLAPGERWDLLLSPFDSTDRSGHVYNSFPADRRVVLIQPQYAFADEDVPGHVDVFRSESTREDDFFQDLGAWLGDIHTQRVAVDITALLRPHVVFLLRWLMRAGIRDFHAVYAEPSTYVKREDTAFISGGVDGVRPIAACEGIHPLDLEPSELLIVLAGYERELIFRAADARKAAQKIVMLGFPPLQADFYQENIIQVYRAAESLGPDIDDPLFAPANDPFATAAVLSRAVARERKARKLRNVFIAPVSTKAQALGAALYYVWEGLGESVSLIYPFAREYNKRAAVGVSRVGLFHVLLPADSREASNG